MAFTYRGDLSTNRDKVRFHAGDTVKGAGPRPSDGNFTDAEVDAVMTAEGTWQRAVAALLERLATEWTRYPTFKADGLSLNRTEIAKGYREQAEMWRKRYGQTIPIHVAGQIPKDSYSDDIPNDDTDTTGDYGGSEFQYVRPG